jgi:hypothetical protein
MTISCILTGWEFGACGMTMFLEALAILKLTALSSNSSALIIHPMYLSVSEWVSEWAWNISGCHGWSMGWLSIRQEIQLVFSVIVSVMHQALLQSRIFQLKDIKLLLLHRVLSSKRCIACLQRGFAGWRDCRQQCQSCHRFVVMDIQFCISRLLLQWKN